MRRLLKTFLFSFSFSFPLSFYVGVNLVTNLRDTQSELITALNQKGGEDCRQVSQHLPNPAHFAILP